MSRPVLLTVALFLPLFVHAFDPEDDSFDPEVETVIADGSTRLGDPSPFIREGYEERGFTYVQASKPEGSSAIVQVSFLKMPDQDDPAKALGGAMFLDIDTAKKLVLALEEGAGLEKPVVVWKSGWAGDWTVSYQEEKGVVLEQAMNGLAARFILSVNAARKLAGAVKHSCGVAEKL